VNRSPEDRSPQTARRSRPRFGILAAGWVVAVALSAAACGAGSNGDTRSDAFYEGIEATFLESGLSQELTSCIVNGVRDLDPTTPGMADFEETGDVSDELANEMADLTEACLDSTP
jgi:hypothetical protein